MTLLDRIFPARARQRAELAKARQEYELALEALQANRVKVAAAAAANDAALDAAFAALRRAAEDITTIAPPRNDDGPQGTE